MQFQHQARNLAVGALVLFFNFSALGLVVNQKSVLSSNAGAPATLIPLVTPTPEEEITPVPKPSRGTELRLALRDSDGKNVKPTRAELYLFSWNIDSVVALHIEDNQVILLLDDDWRRSDVSHGFDVTGANYRIYIEAGGFAPIQSKPFSWLAMFGGLRDSAAIEFPENPPIGISGGEKRVVDLKLRKPQTRFLKLIDDQGKPVPDARVTTSAFHQAENHCGVISASLLSKGVSDSNGRVSVADGDVEYVFEIIKPYYSIKDSRYFEELFIYLKSEETVVQLHKQQRKPLHLLVLSKGKPAPGLTLVGERDGYGCYLQDTIGRTDENGRIDLLGFYPEQWRYAHFDEKDDHEDSKWEGKPSDWLHKRGVIVIELEP